LTPLDLLADQSPHLWFRPLVGKDATGQPFELPRYYFVGPQPAGGERMAKLALFAGIHGDELEGTLALWRLLSELEAKPAAAAGCVLYCYPVCNPSGLEKGTRLSDSGKDLDQEFWRNSTEPEVRLLESELRARWFDGIVSLHSHRATSRCFGLINGDMVSERLLEAALDGAEDSLPCLRLRNGERRFLAPGMLQAPPDSGVRPFEVALVAPRKVPIHLQVEGMAAALGKLLAEYRRLCRL
jgi:hypothetical protein